MPPTLFDAAQPRDDVLAGTLNDAVFAANLDEVVAGTAPAIYGDPAAFFAGTYPSSGLKALLEEVLGRLGGGRPDAAPVVRLETNLGGGKTHNLIALWHAAHGGLSPMAAMEFMDPGLLPGEPVRQTAAFVGTAVGATGFPATDGVTPRTMWGHLALQLGGTAAYEEVRADDERLTAPGARAFARIVGNRPTLILVDEVARYLAVAEGVAVGTTTLANQVAAFLMALLEAVAGAPRAAVVLTTTQITDAFGAQTEAVLGAVQQAQSLVARKEHVLRPSDEADLPHILARRLFAKVDPTAAEAVGRAYAEAATDAFARGADLPPRTTSPAWASEVARSYPFHPELVAVLDKRLSTIPNFQRTRGALRLLARTVRRLWAERPPGTCLVHPHHVDLGDKDTVEDLTSRLDRPAYEPVVRADVASQPGGAPSHAEEIDARLGGVPFATRLATTAYLYSLTRDTPGVTASVLLGAVLAPGDDPNVAAKALDDLEAAAWYLHTDARGFRFSTEQSLTKRIAEAEGQITPGQARKAATDVLRGQFRDSALKVRAVWEDARIPDRDDAAWLAVLHWDDFGDERGVVDPMGAVPAQVRSLWETKPAGGQRLYRNRMVLLAPSAGTHEAMVRAVRRRLALDALATGGALGDLSAEKRKELEDRRKASELEARVAVCNHVDVLYVPQAGGLEPTELPTATTAAVPPNQTDAVLDRLRAMEKTLAAGDPALDPAFVRSKLASQLDAPTPTAELVRAFARRTDLKLVLDAAQVVNLIVAGVANGVWEYHDPERGDDGWATEDRSGVAVRLAEDTFLHPVGSAPAVASSAPSGGGLLLPPLSRPPGAGTDFAGEGKAEHALRSAREQAAEAGRRQVRALRLTVDSEDRATNAAELARLLSVVPPTTAGARLVYRVETTVQLDAPEHALVVGFTGPAEKFALVRSGLDAALRAHDATLHATATATFDPPTALSGDAIEQVATRAKDTGPGKCRVTITTEGGA